MTVIQLATDYANEHFNENTNTWHAAYCGYRDGFDYANNGLKDVINDLINQKKNQYQKVMEWFEKEYNSSSHKDTVDEYEKTGSEYNAQIKLLEFIYHLFSTSSKPTEKENKQHKQ